MNLSKIPDAQKAFDEKQRYVDNSYDEDLAILFNWQEYYEQEVIEIIKKITKRLEDPGDIHLKNYGTIALCLVVVKSILEPDVDIKRAKELLISNLEGEGKYLKSDEIFNTYIGEIDKIYKEEYMQLREEMVRSLNKNIVVIEDFEYLHEQVKVLVDYVRKNEEFLLRSGYFAKKLDIVRTAKMFKECSPKEKQELRRAFGLVYRTSNIKSYMSEDYDAIKELLELIKKDYEIEKDRIQRRQYEYFINNLGEILEKLK